MSLFTRSHDLVPFPTPYGNREIYYPDSHRNFFSSLYASAPRRFPHLDGHYRRPGCFLNDHKDLKSLQDANLEAAGDLGWTLDYATAWCYAHLTRNQPAVAEIIDAIREIDVVNRYTPYIIFDPLDKALFDGKLRDMVHVRWWSDSQICSPGTTSAPGVVPGVARICIDLNSTKFEVEHCDIDDLLEAQIHQMIHAFFLVCCGAQKKGERADGRLKDDINFGVLLMTIRDISRQCEEGELEFIFHATKQRDPAGCMGAARLQMIAAHTGSMLNIPSRSMIEPFIAGNPSGGLLGHSLADGQSHCLRENRHVTFADLKNWQVSEVSRALELDMDSQGDKVWEFDDDGKLGEVDRLQGPPSATYIELLFEHELQLKRVMAKREKALKFKSIEKVLMKYERYELKVPRCDFATFKCVWDFINKDGYCATPLDKDVHWPATTGRGPPVLRRRDMRIPGPNIQNEPDTSIITHIKVFKAAEGMKFEELMQYALDHMYHVPITTEDPIALLKELYNEEEGFNSNPISSELHKWSRKFLLKTEDQRADYLSYADRDHDIYHRRHTLALNGGSGATNLQRIAHWYPEEGQELYTRSAAFRDDVDLVQHLPARDAYAASDHYVGTRVRINQRLGYDRSLMASSNAGRGLLGGNDFFGNDQTLPRARLLDGPLGRAAPYFGADVSAARSSRTRTSEADFGTFSV